jgi:hypothetical protein
MAKLRESIINSLNSRFNCIQYRRLAIYLRRNHLVPVLQVIKYPIVLFLLQILDDSLLNILQHLSKDFTPNTSERHLISVYLRTAKPPDIPFSLLKVPRELR